MSKKSIYSVDVDREAAFAGDVPELTAEFFRTAQIRHGDKILREGTFARPMRNIPGQRDAAQPGDEEKVEQHLSLSPEVLEHFRSNEPGWQARINAALREHVRNAADSRS